MASERALPNRRKKPASKGRRIAISDAVYARLNSYMGPRKSFDCLLRELLGLPDRKGNPTDKALIEGWISEGKFFFDEADARGHSCLIAARRKTKRVSKPIKVRECA